MASRIVKIFFDGEEKECLVQTSANGEYVCTARDGQFVKFPAAPEGQDADAHIDAQVAAHNADDSNVIVPVTAEEEAEKKAELDAWLGRTAEADAQIIEAGDVGSVEEVLGQPPTG